jgi:hypothetical protein
MSCCLCRGLFVFDVYHKSVISPNLLNRILGQDSTGGGWLASQFRS